MSRIAIDMDEVLVDTLSKQLRWLAEQRGVVLDRTQFHGQHLREVAGAEHYAALREAMHQPDFFLDLPVMPGALRSMSLLFARHQVFIATAAMEFPPSFNSKFSWLQTHFPYLPAERIVFCGDKSIVQADYLIDDHARHFTHFRGQGLLFAAAHNRDVAGYPVMQDWEGVLRYFKMEEAMPQVCHEAV